MSFVLDSLVTDPTAAVGTTATLRASHCSACGRTEFPALTSCPACGAEASTIALGPEATLGGFTAVLHAPPGAAVDVPYTLAVATFADANLAVMGLLDQHVAPDELQIGQPLEVCIVATREATTYGFRLT